MTQPTRRTFLALSAVPLVTLVVPELGAMTLPRQGQVQVHYVADSATWQRHSPELASLLEQRAIPTEQLVAARRATPLPERPVSVRLAVCPLFTPTRPGPEGIKRARVELLSRTHGLPLSVYDHAAGSLSPTTAPTSLRAPVDPTHGVELAVTLEDDAPITIALGGPDLPLAAGAWIIAARRGADLLTLAVLVEPPNTDTTERLA